MPHSMRPRSLVACLLISVVLSGCSWFRGLNHGNAKDNAVQALVTTTRSAVILMTLAGLAYDAGAFGQPGTPRAEATWDRIAAASVSAGEALDGWTEAIRTNRDTTAFAALVAQALAVITALLPPRTVSDLLDKAFAYVPTHAALECPEMFRARAITLAGGA